MSYPPDDKHVSDFVKALFSSPGGGTSQPAPTSALGLSLLLSKATRVEDRFYRNVRVDLDGYHFINCGFQNCEFGTITGDFKIEGCVIRGCTAPFSRATVRQIKLFSYIEGIGLPPDYSFTMSDDAVTIL